MDIQIALGVTLIGNILVVIGIMIFYVITNKRLNALEAKLK